jgi:cell shape-determining protein MreD
VRTFLFYLVFFEIAFLLEGTIRHFPLITVRIDIVWLAVLYFGFYLPLFPGGVWVLMIGLAQEALGAPFHGPLSLSYLGIYFFLRLTHRQLFFEGRFAQILWIVLLTLAQKGIEGGLLRWQGYAAGIHLGNLLMTAFLNGLVSQVLFPFLQKEGRLSPRYGA